MSGGAYDYLCYAAPEDLLQRISDIEAIRERAAELGYSKLEQKIQILVKTCEDTQSALMTQMEVLQSALHTIEWFDSGDIGEEECRTLLSQYESETAADSKTHAIMKMAEDGVIEVLHLASEEKYIMILKGLTPEKFGYASRAISEDCVKAGIKCAVLPEQMFSSLYKIEKVKKEN